MILPWRGTTPEISSEADSRYETPGGAQNKVNVSQEYLLHLLKLAVTGLSDGSEAAIARYSTPYDITYDWLKDRLDAADTRFKNLKVYNVKDYGAFGDLVADDTAAVNNAIAAIPENSSGILYFPAGRYKITSKISIVNKGVKVQGLEKITSQIYFYDCDGFEHTGEYHFTIQDIGMYTNNKTRTAIYIPQRLTLNTFELRDVDMWGFPYGAKNWAVGIHLEDVSNTWMYRHTFIGDYTNSPFADGVAVKIDSTVAKGSTGHHMIDCTWNYASTALDIDAKHNISIEGVRVDKCGMVGVINGVNFDGSTSGYIPPLFTMTSSHIDCKENGTAVYLNSVAQAEISGCDLYGFSVNNKIVEAINCTQLMITGNFLVAGTALGTTAINIKGSSAVQVENNQFNGNWVNGLVFDADCVLIYEKNNKYFGVITNKIIDGSGLLFANSGNSCLLTRITSQSITTATNTKIVWTNASSNWHSMWSADDPTKIVIPHGVTRVRINGQVRFNNESVIGTRTITILKNNVYVSPLPVVDIPAAGAGETTINFSSGNIDVGDNEYIELQVMQSSGSTITLSEMVTFIEVEVIDYFTR